MYFLFLLFCLAFIGSIGVAVWNGVFGSAKPPQEQCEQMKLKLIQESTPEQLLTPSLELKAKIDRWHAVCPQERSSR